jgi:hypothetical protein
MIWEKENVTDSKKMITTSINALMVFWFLLIVTDYFNDSA